MESKSLHKFSSFKVTPLSNSNYIHPYRLVFTQNKVKRVWDGIQCHSSVSCLIFNTDRKCLVLVRQFRPVVYVNQVLEASDSDSSNSLSSNLNWSASDPNKAFTYELCAGICDKNKSLKETIREEILEECGYDVSADQVFEVNAFRMGVGLIGALHTVFYAEVTDAMRVEGAGGGNTDEGEFIDLFELPEEKVKEFMQEKRDGNATPPGLLYALMWFLYERKEFMEKKKNI